MELSPNITKIVQVAGVLLAKEPRKTMDKLRLLKLLYIADRISLQETGTPIIGTRMVAMKHGPLHSIILDYINGRRPDENVWQQFFSTEGHQVQMTEAPPRSELSEYEIELLEKVWAEQNTLGTWELVEATHDFPEWKKNFQNDTSSTIPLEDVLHAVGRDGDIEHIINEMKARDELQRLFSGTASAECP